MNNFYGTPNEIHSPKNIFEKSINSVQTQITNILSNLSSDNDQLKV